MSPNFEQKIVKTTLIGAFILAILISFDPLSKLSGLDFIGAFVVYLFLWLWIIPLLISIVNYFKAPEGKRDKIILSFFISFGVMLTLFIVFVGLILSFDRIMDFFNS